MMFLLQLPPPYDVIPARDPVAAPPYSPRDARAPSYEAAQQVEAVCCCQAADQQVGHNHVTHATETSGDEEDLEVQRVTSVAASEVDLGGSCNSVSRLQRQSFRRKRASQLLQSLRRRSPTPVSASPTEAWVSPMTETHQAALRSYDSLDELCRLQRTESPRCFRTRHDDVTEPVYQNIGRPGNAAPCSCSVRYLAADWEVTQGYRRSHDDVTFTFPRSQNKKTHSSHR